MGGILKLCSACGKEKSLVEFHAQIRGKYRKRGRCILCISSDNRKRYSLPHVKERSRELGKQYRKTKKYKDKYKERVDKTINSRVRKYRLTWHHLLTYSYPP